MGDEATPPPAGYEGTRNDTQRRDGTGVATFASGETYAGDYVDGRRQGEGSYTFGDGGKYVGQVRYATESPSPTHCQHVRAFSPVPA